VGTAMETVHSVNFNFTSLRLEKHGITEGKMMHTVLEKLTAWHKFVAFNTNYNFHTNKLIYLTTGIFTTN
jgi:hypothetical protein